MTVRKGVNWSDGKAMTPADVKYSFDLAKIATHPQHPLWADTGLQSTKVSGNDVVFTFSRTPGLPAVRLLPLQRRGRPAAHLQELQAPRTSRPATSGTRRRSSAPARTRTSRASARRRQTVVWKKRNGWWATKALGLNVAPTYVVDIKNGTNAAALSNLLAGNIDLFNNFAPKSAIKGKFKTYFNGAPYHLGANTTWLFPNTTKEPMNDKKFRRALAFSINMNQILDKAYQGLVNKASPTGLLPIWDKWVDQKVVKQYGFSYNAATAKQILADAGYKDTNGDGFVENKDGSPIDLKIVCPNGWSDWMTSIQVIADSAKAVGIKITPEFPEYGTLVDDRGHANYDLLLGNDRQYSNTPWTYYQYIFQLPIQKNQTTRQLRALHEPDRLEPGEAAGQDADHEQGGVPGDDDQAADDLLQDLPAIPLWYNGMWSMVNTQYWTNWPSSTSGQFTPTSWRNYWQMTAIDMLTKLAPRARKKDAIRWSGSTPPDPHREGCCVFGRLS